MIDKRAIPNEPIVVFGFGAQGSAQAANLKDSGMDVSVCLPDKSPRAPLVKEAGIKLRGDAVAAAKSARIAAILIPDGKQSKLYKEVLEPNLPQGAALVFAHGFAIHYQEIVPRPDLDVILVAPLAQGATLRSEFLSGNNVPCLLAVVQNATGRARERALAYARSIGRDGPFTDTAIAQEVEIDLFVEQAVLCGGMPELVRQAFETLVEKGYNPDIAYYCCLKELKAIVNLMDRYGIAGMRGMISDTACYGAMTRGPRIIDAHTRDQMRRVLDEIISGAFAREVIDEKRKGNLLLEEALTKEKKHPIEVLHQRHVHGGSHGP